MQYLSFFFVLFSFQLFASPPLTEQEVVTRVSHHLVLENYTSALKEVEKGKTLFPQSQQIQKIQIEALAKALEEMKMLEALEIYLANFPKDLEDQEFLETASWGVLQHAGESSLLPIQIAAMLGAVYTQDVRAVDLVYHGLHHTSGHVRSAAIQLVPYMRDQKLVDALVQLYVSEDFWPLRLEILKVFAKMRVSQVKKRLEMDLETFTSDRVETLYVVQALAEIDENVDDEEIQRLLTHPRFPLRALSCELVYQHDIVASVPLLLPLLSDTRPEVVVSALNVLVLMRENISSKVRFKEQMHHLLAHNDPAVTITAAWGLALMEDEQGVAILKDILNTADMQTRRLAAGAVSALGEKGLSIAVEAQQYADPYIQATLAWSCLQQREHVQEAAHVLMDFLEQQPANCFWDESGNALFRRINASEARHHPFISNYPKVLDQRTRLSLLNLLVIVEYPLSQEAIKKFLKEPQWHISGMAALLLLEEGDRFSTDCVEELMEDEDPIVRLNAALLLALWGKEQRVIPYLEKAYPEANRWQKIQILDAIGAVGAHNSKTFLLNALSESSQMLRLVSASALIRCLRNGS